MFARWGRLVYVARWPVLVATVPFLILAFAAVVLGKAPNYNGQPPVEAGRASTLIDNELPSFGTSFELVFASATHRAVDPAFRKAMQAALAPLTGDSRVTAVQTPYSAGASSARALISRDGHMALALVSAGNIDDYAALRKEVRSPSLRISSTGNFAVNHDINTYLSGDLARTSGAILPIALILLLIVFGTVIAAVLPLGVAVLALIAGVGSIFILGRVTDVTQYSINLDALIGLGVAIDYSLFIVNRFREELARGNSIEQSVATAVATAGRAVFFSSLTVAIGLSGLFFYQGTYLQTLGVAGAIAVLLAVFCALTFLPALLAVLGHRVNRFRVPVAWSASTREGGFWHGVATWVMRRPLLALIPALAVLLLLAAPITRLSLANSDIRALPPQAPSRQAFDLVNANFPGEGQNHILVVLYYPDARPITPQRAGYLYDLSHQIASLPGVSQVASPLNAVPGLTRAEVVALAGNPVQMAQLQQQPAVRQYIGNDIVELQVSTRYATQTDEARSLVGAIRALPQPPGGQHLVTGATALDVDSINYVKDRTPLAVGYIVLVTYLVLFLLLGSVILPLKAVLMNFVSICASFGALVWIFQQGHLSGLLNFTPQEIDPTNLILLFCIVFGLSMDYEVFLLTRIQEQYQRTGDTRSSVAMGLQRSGRLITGAAAIMVGVFLAFGGLANTVIIKEIGLGLAIAVAMDATIVRAIVVPALMRLLGGINWWAPAPLTRLYARLGLAERT